MQYGIFTDISKIRILRWIILKMRKFYSHLRIYFRSEGCWKGWKGLIRVWLWSWATPAWFFQVYDLVPWSSLLPCPGQNANLYHQDFYISSEVFLSYHSSIQRYSCSLWNLLKSHVSLNRSSNFRSKASLLNSADLRVI